MVLVDAGMAQGASVVSFKHNGNSVRQALAAACVAAGMLLAGCDSSSSTSTAQNATDDAAGRAVSAGEPRATDKLMDAASGDLKALQNTLESKVKSGSTISDYVVQNGADKDLDAAIKQLQGAITTDTPSALKAGLLTQLGSIQLNLAEYRQGVLQADIIEINQQAAQLQTLAQAAANLYAQADVLEKGALAPDSTEADKARTAVADRQKALADAQAKAAALQDQIGQKEAAARQIYTDTDAAFTAADTKKGQTAITAGNKAMDDRKQADTLMAEAGNLGPQFARAQADLTLAQVALNDAQQKSQLAQAAYDQAKAASSQTATRVTALRGAAAKIVGDAANPDSLTSRYKAFLDLAGKLDIEVRNAVAPADAASSSFKSAYDAHNTYFNETLKKADDTSLKPDDPLRKALKDDRLGVILSWSQSAAQQQAGRSLLAGAQASDTITDVSALAGAAKVTIDPKVSLNGTQCREDAAKRFLSAATIAKTADGKAAPANSDLDRIKWIGFSLEASANHGAYLAGNAAALDLAKAAKATAVGRNPTLAAQLDWIK